MDDRNRYTIAIIGGTGKEGKGLAYRWAKAGHKVIIGSRSKEKALAAVNELQSQHAVNFSKSCLFINKRIMQFCWERI